MDPFRDLRSSCLVATIKTVLIHFNIESDSPESCSEFSKGSYCLRRQVNERFLSESHSIKSSKSWLHILGGVHEWILSPFSGPSCSNGQRVLNLANGVTRLYAQRCRDCRGSLARDAGIIELSACCHSAAQSQICRLEDSTSYL